MAKLITSLLAAFPLVLLLNQVHCQVDLNVQQEIPKDLPAAPAADKSPPISDTLLGKGFVPIQEDIISRKEYPKIGENHSHPGHSHHHNDQHSHGDHKPSGKHHKNLEDMQSLYDQCASMYGGYGGGFGGPYGGGFGGPYGGYMNRPHGPHGHYGMMPHMPYFSNFGGPFRRY